MKLIWRVAVRGLISGRSEMLLVSAVDEKEARAIVNRDLPVMQIVRVSRSETQRKRAAKELRRENVS